MEVNTPSTLNNTLPFKTFSNLFQNMFDAIVIYNYETEIVVDCNPSFLKLIQYEKEKLLTLNRFDLMPRYSSLYPNVDIHQIIRNDHRSKVLAGETVYATGEFIDKNGDSIFAEFNIVPTGNEKGEAFVIVHNITQNLENNRILNESKEKYQTIVDNACESIIYLDLETQKLIECNQVVMKMFGVSSRNVLLNSNPIQFYADNREFNKMKPIHFFKTCVFQAIRNGNSCNEFIAKRKDGTTFAAEITTVHLSKKDKKAEAIFFVKDVTEQFYAQKERDQLYHEQSQILDSMPFQFSQKDLENNIVKSNKAMNEYLNGTSETVVGENLSKFIPDTDAEKIHQEDLAIAKTKQPKLNFVFETLNINKEKIWGRIDKVPLFDKEGEVNGILSYVVDISDLMESQKKTKQSENNYRALFDNAFDGILLYDCNAHKNIRCNLKLASYLSSNTDVILKTRLEDFSPEYQSNGMKSSQFFEMIINKTKKRGTYHTEWIFEEKNGDLLISEISTYLIPQENTCQVVLIFKDITEQREQEDIIKTNVVELNKKNIELQKYIESNNQLENFAAIASHDLQAPLRTIHSYTQLLQKSIKDNATDQQNEYMHFITSATGNMRHLIRDLRAFSKVDSTKLHIRTINSDFMLEEVLSELKATIDYKKASVGIPKHLPTIIGDRIKLKQLFQNLITNALKYIGKDVVPDVKILFEDQENQWIFKVKDNGIGIAPKNQQKIFQLFQRLHAADEYTGTGIGLSLCKKVVDQHFGKIGVESELGKGSVFYFSIPKNVEMRIREIM